MSFISPVFLRVKYYCKFLSDFESPPFDRFHRSICHLRLLRGAARKKKKKLKKKDLLISNRTKKEKDQRLLNAFSISNSIMSQGNIWIHPVFFHKTFLRSCKFYNSKYTIASIQITNTEILAFVAVLFFKLLGCKILFMNTKDKRNC